MKFSVMCDCIFGHYLLTPSWTYNHINFELVSTGFPFGLPRLMLYVNFENIIIPPIKMHVKCSNTFHMPRRTYVPYCCSMIT